MLPQGTGVAEALKFYEVQGKPPSQSNKRPSSIQPGQAVSALPNAVTPSMAYRVPTPAEEHKASTRALVDAAYLQLHPHTKSVSGYDESLNVLEEQIKAIANRQSYLVEEERANRQRFEGALKVSNEQTALVVNDLATKVAALEANLSRKQDNEAELLSKIRQSEQTNRELQNFIKSFQYQTEKELSQLRDALNEKHNEDQIVHTRNKEKNAALFTEVVRLGQEFDKLSENLAGSLAMLDQKVQTIEARADKTALEISTSEHTGGNFAEILARYSERTEGRINQLETAFSSIVTELKGEKDEIGRIDGYHAQSVEEVKEMLRHAQRELTSMVETGLLEVHNRIKGEQEDRVRLAEDIKYKLELREKFEGGHNKTEKENLREAYKELEQMIKNQITHQAETLRNMENTFDSQIKATQAQIRKEEISRAQQELLLKSDITKLAEQLRTDYELFKSQQNQLTEKITEMIKLEVETRLQGEKETKTVTEAMFKKFVDDMTAFREAVEKQNRRFAKDLKETSTESSDRANFLSRYIEDLVKKQEESTDSQMQKIKMLCAKLTEQVKEHIKYAEKTFSEIRKNQDEELAEITEKVEEGLAQSEHKEIDMGIRIAIDQAITKVEFDKVYGKLKAFSEKELVWKAEINQEIDKLGEGLKRNDEACLSRNEDFIKKASEQIDRKIQATLEQLKKANQDLWELSVKLSEKQFSREGVKEVLELVPPQVMKMPDIKGAIGELVNNVDKGYPKPRVKMPKALGKQEDKKEEIVDQEEIKPKDISKEQDYPAVSKPEEKKTDASKPEENKPSQAKPAANPSASPPTKPVKEEKKQPAAKPEPSKQAKKGPTASKPAKK